MVKAGDKVRVTTDEYPNQCPRGTICTVTEYLGDGAIRATIDGGNGWNWFLFEGRYEVIQDEEPEYNYAEQAAKHGIKITAQVGDMSVTYDGSK